MIPKFRIWDWWRMIYDPGVGFMEWKYTYRISDIFNEYAQEPMQFTWLQDKNHKDIYEWDILESTRPAKDRYLVVWDEGDAAFYAKDMHFGSLWKIPNNQNCVIIGNAYENPELMDQ